MRRLLTGLLAFMALAGLIWAGYAYMEPRQRARAVQEELRAQRLDADACRRGLVTAEAGFREYDERVDSLRDRVDSYEALHPDGVPADSFGVYLEAFDEYNDAVEGWDERAENLRRQREACVDIVETHNELSDSLRGILRELGELEADGNRGGNPTEPQNSPTPGNLRGPEEPGAPENPTGAEEPTAAEDPTPAEGPPAPQAPGARADSASPGSS